MLPETSGSEAETMAERLCETVRGHTFTIGEQEQAGRITVSIGVATYPQHAQDIDGLVHAADMALLQAKIEKDRGFLASSAR